jgi:glucosamine 6-phosphate synthetase-like amidotransferase/phosphosugar isomerase protein
MKTIEALENDILLQIPYLQDFSPKKPIPEKKQNKTIFCGSGDSLAAAMLAESFSNFKVHAVDPLDLRKNPTLLKKNHIYIISISGNTISNVKVAQIANDPIAISSNYQSKLVKACSKRILLDYPTAGVFTSGSIGFIASALTCISLVSRFKIKNELDLFKRAIIESKKMRLGKKIFLIGNMHTYPIAMYGAAKFYELLGKDAHYERIEQFMHMGVFSANPGDTVIIFEEKNPHNVRISKNLKKFGLRVFQPDSGTKDKISQVIFFSLVSQLTPLFYAKKKHQKDCYFVTAKKLRHASSVMIY